MWFKVVLLVLFGGSVFLNVAQAGGRLWSKPTPTSSAIAGLLNLVLFFGVWVYV
jgi:hypothetical protein